MGEPFTLTEQEIANIKAEYKRYKKEERVISQEIHQQTMENWEAWRPQMYHFLKDKGLLETMAFVCQVRMLDEERKNLDAGMYCTDAREQAWANCMMQGEPYEEEDEEDEEAKFLEYLIESGNTAFQWSKSDLEMQLKAIRLRKAGKTSWEDSEMDEDEDEDEEQDET